MTPQVRRLDALEEGVGELVERRAGSPDLPDLEQYADDPVGFIRDVLGDDPWEMQVEVAEAVRDDPMVAVQSCNGTGKDWLDARLSLWWCYARNGLVVLTGPTRQQVEEILMRREVREAFHGSGLPGELHVRALRPGGDGRAGIIAKTATAVSTITGLHASDVLFSICEAQHEDLDVAFRAAFANAVGERDRIFAYGNPTVASGPFYDACQPGSDWRTIKVAAEDVPNVVQGEEIIPGLMTRQGVERIRRQYGKDSPYYRSRVEAEFPEDAVDALIGRDELQAAAERHREETSPEGFYVLGVDPARHGPDETVVCIRRGGHVVGFESWSEGDTQESARRVLRLARRVHEGGDSPVKAIYVDEIGLGGGVVDRLKEDVDLTWQESTGRGLGGHRTGLTRKSTRVKGFNSAKSAPDSDRFDNVRAQAFWTIRRMLEEDELALPDDRRLMEELTALRVEYTPSGKVRIGGKEDIKRRIGRSPDRADALAVSLRSEFNDGEGGKLFIGGIT